MQAKASSALRIGCACRLAPLAQFTFLDSLFTQVCNWQSQQRPTAEGEKQFNTRRGTAPSQLLRGGIPTPTQVVTVRCEAATFLDSPELLAQVEQVLGQVCQLPVQAPEQAPGQRGFLQHPHQQWDCQWPQPPRQTAAVHSCPALPSARHPAHG